GEDRAAQARPREGQELDGEGRAADRPRRPLPRRRRADDAREAQQSEPRDPAQAAQGDGRGGRKGGGCRQGCCGGGGEGCAGSRVMRAGSRAGAERVCVAGSGAAQGTRGEVRLWTSTADPMAVTDYGPLETEDGSTRFEIESVRPAKAHLVARLKGVNDRAAAEKFVHIDLYVPRERLPLPEADEFYHADLIGLAAFTPDGRRFGTVVAVHDFGAGDLIELRPDNASDTVLLPFTETTVPEVDIAGGRIVIDPPQDAPKDE